MTKTIEEILKDMPLDESVKSRLQESWTASLNDARIAQESTIKAELSARYNKDIEKIQEAVGTYLEERLTPHLTDLHEGVESVEAMKLKYAKKTQQVKEAAQAYVRKRLGAIEKVVENHVRAELAELHEDVVANRRAALQAITEKTAQLDSDRQKLKNKGAAVLENIINVKLPAQLEELKEDIEAARKDNFGREIFEAFSTMFRRQFFDTSAEFQKVITENKKLIAETRKTKAIAAKVVKESKEEAVAAKRAYGKLNESVTRHQTMARLLQPLSGTPRAQMKALLEATKTDKLAATYRKALPQIVREAKATSTAPAAKPLRESTKKPAVRNVEFRDGGSQKLNESDYDEFDTEVADIRRLAGNK